MPCVPCGSERFEEKLGLWRLPLVVGGLPAGTCTGNQGRPHVSRIILGSRAEEPRTSVRLRRLNLTGGAQLRRQRECAVLSSALLRHACMRRAGLLSMSQSKYGG